MNKRSDFFIIFLLSACWSLSLCITFCLLFLLSLFCRCRLSSPHVTGEHSFFIVTTVFLVLVFGIVGIRLDGFASLVGILRIDNASFDIIVSSRICRTCTSCIY